MNQFSLVEPETLPGREIEISRIYNSLSSSIQSGKGLTMSISGSAGSGKSASVAHVIKKLKNDVKEVFYTVYINALKLKDRKDSFGIVWEILKQNISIESLKKSEKMESIPQRIAFHFAKCDLYCVITLDEMDFLKGKYQTEIYEFFNWPQIGSCAVIGISNNVSLIENLMPKISSRLEATERIIFSTYSQKQIAEILKERLKGTTIFQDSALDFASRKIASTSGDIRKGLTICQKAVQIRQERSKMRSRIKEDQVLKKIKMETRVTVDDMHEAFQLLEKQDSWPLEKLGLFERVFLVSIHKATLSQKDKDGYCPFDNVIQRVQTTLKQMDQVYHAMTYSLLKPAFDTLLGMRLVESRKTTNEIYPRVRLVIGSEMVETLKI